MICKGSFQMHATRPLAWNKWWQIGWVNIIGLKNEFFNTSLLPIMSTLCTPSVYGCMCSCALMCAVKCSQNLPNIALATQCNKLKFTCITFASLHRGCLFHCPQFALIQQRRSGFMPYQSTAIFYPFGSQLRLSRDRNRVSFLSHNHGRFNFSSFHDRILWGGWLQNSFIFIAFIIASTDLCRRIRTLYDFALWRIWFYVSFLASPRWVYWPMARLPTENKGMGIIRV